MAKDGFKQTELYAAAETKNVWFMFQDLSDQEQTKLIEELKDKNYLFNFNVDDSTIEYKTLFNCVTFALSRIENEQRKRASGMRHVWASRIDPELLILKLFYITYRKKVN